MFTGVNGIIISLLFMGCRSDDGLKVYNTEPNATITSHDDESTFTDAVEYTFMVLIDSNHQNEQLLVRWSTNERGCPRCSPNLMEGSHAASFATDIQLRLESLTPKEQQRSIHLFGRRRDTSPRD